MREIGDMTITLRPGTVELRGSIRTAEDLRTLIDRLAVISDWMAQEAATREEPAGRAALNEARDAD
jgi:hypothetical protein